MLKKLGVIALLFLGSLIFAIGMTSPIFDKAIGITFYSHVIGGIAIIIFGVILYKKYVE
jgi:hypothetical protein